jgi:AcrR family transcriptional regulator
MKQTKASAPAPDRRVRRTRRQLRDALVSMILERGWDEVSVQDVCARADVGRSTFYVHFADKEELLFSGFEELHATLDGIRGSAAGGFEFAQALLEHARENLRLYRALIGRKSGQQMMLRFRDVVLRLVDAELAGLPLDAERRVLAARYIAGGFLEMLTSWLDRPARVEPASLAAEFRRLTSGVLQAAGGR